MFIYVFERFIIYSLMMCSSYDIKCPNVSTFLLFFKLWTLQNFGKNRKATNHYIIDNQTMAFWKTTTICLIRSKVQLVYISVIYLFFLIQAPGGAGVPPFSKEKVHLCFLFPHCYSILNVIIPLKKNADNVTLFITRKKLNRLK